MPPDSSEHCLSCCVLHGSSRVSPDPEQLHQPLAKGQLLTAAPGDAPKSQQAWASQIPQIHPEPETRAPKESRLASVIQSVWSFAQGMRKEQEPAPEHQHFKAACQTSCVSKFQTDCSHMQTCPKELHKTCLSIHPKHIKFPLQEHMFGSLKAPHSQPTQAAEPPRIPWVTHKNLLLQSTKDD